MFFLKRQKNLLTLFLASVLMCTFLMAGVAFASTTPENHDENRITRLWNQLVKISRLTPTEAEYAFSFIHKALEADILTEDEWEHIENIGTARLTKDEIESILSVVEEKLINKWPQFQNAIHTNDIIWVVNFIKDVRNAFPVEFRNALAQKGITVEDAIAAILVVSSELKSFTTMAQLKVDIDNILLTGIISDEDKATLVRHGINWANVNKFVALLTPDEKANLRSIINKLLAPIASPDSPSGKGGSGGSVSDLISVSIKPNAAISLVSADGKLKLFLSEGLVSENATFSVTKLSADKQIAGNQNVIKIGNYQYLIEVKTLSGTPIREFSKKIVFEFEFTDSDLPSGVKKDHLKLCYWHSKAKVWVALPTIVEGNKVKAFTNHLTVFGLMAMPNVPKITDVTGHWGEIDIVKIVSLSIASGDPSGKFRPNDQITRQEFAKIAVLAAGLQPEVNPKLTFKDAGKVSPWADGYVAAAVKAGMIKGYEDNTFRPTDNISRAEVAAIVIRALDIKASNAKLNFIDIKKIPSWGTEYVAAAVDYKIIDGYPDKTIRATGKTTRAEAAKMVSRMFEVQVSK